MLAPWRSPLARALHLNRSLVYARYLQLATVRLDGKPANRTVVFRGFLDDGNQLKFITDTRSEKSAQISAQNWGEVCWYFPKSREQFRLLGRLTLVDSEYSEPVLQKARRMQWHDLSDAARVQFAWPQPGQERRDSEDAFSPPAPSSNEPLPNFCLLLLDPTQVDHLELRGEPQNRHQYGQDAVGNWFVQAINP